MTAILNFICIVSIEIFVMAYGQILNLNQINNDTGTNKNCRVSFVVEYTIMMGLSIIYYKSQ